MPVECASVVRVVYINSKVTYSATIFRAVYALRNAWVWRQIWTEHSPSELRDEAERYAKTIAHPYLEGIEPDSRVSISHLLQLPRTSDVEELIVRLVRRELESI